MLLRSHGALRAAVAALLLATACDDAEPDAPAPGQREPVTLPDGRMCFDEEVFLDADGDGYGDEDESKRVCLAEDEEEQGYVRRGGDCAPDDADVHAGRPEICGDNLDENCTDADEECPESLSAEIARANWDCSGDPPDHVIAWARFGDNEFYEPGACFVIYEGLPDEFYVEPVNLQPAAEKVARGPMGMCESVEGCICPSIDNWSFDRGRLYAFTLRGEPEDCEKIVVMAHAGDQTVSNACRKFLYQIWFNPNDFSFVSDDERELRERLAEYPSLEIACFEGQPFDDLPFASLLTAEIRINGSFQPAERDE